MCVFADLSAYSYRLGAGSRLGILNVGWIDIQETFPTWSPPVDFLDKLWTYCHFRAVLWRHILFCEKCSPKTEIDCVETWGTNQLVLGTAEIRVFSSHGSVYASPDLIFHFVKTHNYRPPDEFIEAIRCGIDPASDRYRAALTAIGLKAHEPLASLPYWPANRHGNEGKDE